MVPLAIRIILLYVTARAIRRLRTARRRRRPSTGLFLAAISLFTAGSAISQSRTPERPWVNPLRPGPDEDPRFFPSGIFGRTDSGLPGWYSGYLRAMGEIPLRDSLNTDRIKAFRLLVLPAHRPPSVIRLMVKGDGSADFVVKQGQSYLHPEKVVFEKSEALSDFQVRTVLQKMERAGYWSMPTNDPITSVVVMGGVDWLIEAFDGDRYQLVVRKSPEPGPFSELLRFLFCDLARFDLPVGSFMRRDR